MIVAGLLVVGVIAAMLVVDVARVAAARTQLTVAADAAALAAAPATFASFGGGGTPWEIAASTAAANGASIVDCECPMDRTWSSRIVVVAVTGTVDLFMLGSRRLQASAAAEFRPIALAG